MPLAPLTLNVTSGIVGRPFTATIIGKSAGSTIEVVNDGTPGFGTVNGRVMHSGLPSDINTVVLRETLAGEGFRDSRIDILADGVLAPDIMRDRWAGDRGLDTYTKRAMYCFGGNGAGQAAPNTDILQRFPVMLPFKTKRWRFRIWNHNAGVPYAGAVNFSGLWVGPAVFGADGDPTGLYATDPVQAYAAFSTAADGSEYVGPWITDAAAQFQPNVYHLLSMGWTTAAANGGRSNAKYWFLSGAGAAAKAGQANPGAMSNTSVTAFDMRIEYEADTIGAVLYVVGDSNSEATSAQSATSPAVPQIWCHQALFGRKGAAVNAARGGAATVDLRNSASWEWTRIGTDVTPDCAVIDLGTNDCQQGRALTTYQQYYGEIVALLRSRFGANLPIYGSTVPPRNFATDTTGNANEALRISYNTWLRSLPLGLAGILDFDKALRDPANERQLLALYAGPDGLHITRQGQQQKAAIAGAVLPNLAA